MSLSRSDKAVIGRGGLVQFVCGAGLTVALAVVLNAGDATARAAAVGGAATGTFMAWSHPGSPLRSALLLWGQEVTSREREVSDRFKMARNRWLALLGGAIVALLAVASGHARAGETDFLTAAVIMLMAHLASGALGWSLQYAVAARTEPQT